MKPLILLSLLSASCLYWTKPNDNHYHLYIDPSFTAEQRGDILNAFESWEGATNGYITFDVNAWTADDPDTISIYPTTMQELDAKESLLGETWNYGVNAKIEIATDSDDFKQTALHEAGHSLGLMHNPDLGNPVSNGIMCWSKGCASTKVECVDVKQLCSHWSCDPNQMGLCQYPVLQ